MREQKLLLALGHALAACPDEKALLRLVRRRLKGPFGVDDAYLFACDVNRQSFGLRAAAAGKNRCQHVDYQALLRSNIPRPHPLLAPLLEGPGAALLSLAEAGRAADAPFCLRFWAAAGLAETLALVLRHGPDVVGILFLAAEQPRAFEGPRAGGLAALAGPMAQALAGLRARPGVDEKAILLSLSHGLASARDKNDLMFIMNAELHKLIPFHHSSIALIDEETQTYRPFVVNLGLTPAAPRPYVPPNIPFYPLTDEVLSTALRHDGPVVFDLDELMNRPQPIAYVVANHAAGIKEMVSVVLRHKGKNIGSCGLFLEQRGTCTPSSLALYHGVSRQLAIAVANIVANEDIQRREQEKTVLLSFNNALAAVRSKGDLFRVINDKFKKLFNFGEYVISLSNPEETTYRVFLYDPKFVAHPDHDWASVADFTTDDGVYKPAMAGEGPRVFSVAALMAPGGPAYMRIWAELGMQELVVTPLRFSNEVVGSLWLYMAETDTFSADKLGLLRGVCSQISIAVANIVANEKIARQLAEIEGYKKQLEEEKLYLQEEIVGTYNHSEIIGAGAEMQKVFHLLSQVAFTNSTVLILGETGTGKELIARAIHNASSRQHKLMVKVNCAALPPNLVESELFGHERGSFTGATERRIGKFELANHGTLFLDEIGELPLDLQVKLLRALQEREIERVGGSATIKTDVRIVTATNRDLQKEVAAGRFRSDLYYRLNVFPITMPPLRERREDIPALAAHFVARYARNAGKKISTVAHKVMQDLLAYSWPGNVRELEHLVERSVLLTSGSTIKDMHLPLRGLDRREAAEGEDFYVKTIDENERDHILAVLKRCKGKVSGADGAAVLLGLPFSTLNSKIRKLGIQKEHFFAPKAAR